MAGALEASDLLDLEAQVDMVARVDSEAQAVSVADTVAVVALSAAEVVPTVEAKEASALITPAITLGRMGLREAVLVAVAHSVHKVGQGAPADWVASADCLAGVHKVAMVGEVA